MPRRRSLKASILEDTGAAVLRGAGRVADYAVQNLPRLIYDGGRVVWPEAYEQLVRVLAERKRGEASLDDVAEAVERTLDGADESWLLERMDSLLQSIRSIWVKGLIATGLAGIRTALKMNPGWVGELESDTDRIVLLVLSKASPEAAKLLEEHPALLRLVGDYMLAKLGLRRRENAEPQGP